MDINELLESSGGLEVWVEYLDGFTLKLRYLSRSELRGLLQSATRRRWDEGAGRILEDLDEETLLLGLSGCILDWRGLTGEVLEKLLPVDASGVHGEVPCTSAVKLALLEEAYDFDDRVREMVVNLALFRQEREEAEVENIRNFRDPPSGGNGVEL